MCLYSKIYSHVIAEQMRFILIYVKGDGDSVRHPKMLALLRLAGDQLIRRRFNTQPDLHSAVYASLVQHLLGSGRIITGPFDATAGDFIIRD